MPMCAYSQIGDVLHNNIVLMALDLKCCLLCQALGTNLRTWLVEPPRVCLEATKESRNEGCSRTSTQEGLGIWDALMNFEVKTGQTDELCLVDMLHDIPSEVGDSLICEVNTDMIS